MTEAMETPDGEVYLAAVAGTVADVEDIWVEFARVKIRELRALAAVGRLADAQGAPRNARVQVHDMVLRSISAEVAGVMRMTDRAVQRRIGEARTIIEGFPAAVAAWERSGARESDRRRRIELAWRDVGGVRSDRDRTMRPPDAEPGSG